MVEEQENYEARTENLDPTRLLVALPGWTVEHYNLRRPDYGLWNLLPRDWIKEHLLKSPTRDNHPLLMRISKKEFYLGLTGIGANNESISLSDITKIAVNPAFRQIIVTARQATCYVWNNGRYAAVLFGSPENRHYADIRVNFSS